MCRCTDDHSVIVHLKLVQQPGAVTDTKLIRRLAYDALEQALQKVLLELVRLEGADSGLGA